MIKIIDVGYLRDAKAEAYLKDDVNNLLAFTDFACMEALKGGVLSNIRNSLEIVAKYANQILILKCLPEIMKVDYNLENFKETFIDADQTLTFPKFCIKIVKSNGSDSEFEKDLLKRSQEATECLDEKRKGAALVFEGIAAFNQQMDQKYLKYVRSGKKWTINEYQYACVQILKMCEILFEKNINNTKMPEKENFINHYIFRYTLSGYLLVLKWLKDHGWESYPDEKKRNDIIDMSYVTFATYFDGVLSNDKKINSIYPKVIKFIEFIKNNASNNSLQRTVPAIR
ncbi:MAG: hypothetical protein ABH865_07450 [Candidatus Omnitrophota bacterium]